MKSLRRRYLEWKQRWGYYGHWASHHPVKASALAIPFKLVPFWLFFGLTDGDFLVGKWLPLLVAGFFIFELLANWVRFRNHQRRGHPPRRIARKPAHQPRPVA